MMKPCRAMLSLLMVLGIPWAGSAAPLLRVEDPVWNVGQIVAGVEQRRSFEVENQGDEELIISEVDVCCGFSGALEQNRLLPGERTLLNVRFKQTKMIGNLHAEIILVSNDPHQPRSPVTVLGDVLPSQHALGELLLPEAYIDLGVVAPGEPVSFAVHLKSVGNQPLQIVGVDKGRYVLEDGTRPLLAPGEVGELRLRYLRQESGPIDEEIFLVTNDPLDRTLPVRLKGYIHKDVLPRSAIVIYPVGESIVYNPELGGYRYQVTVENRSPKPMELLPLASSLPTASSRGGGSIGAQQQTTATVIYPLDVLRQGPTDGRLFLQLVLPVEMR